MNLPIIDCLIWFCVFLFPFDLFCSYNRAFFNVLLTIMCLFHSLAVYFELHFFLFCLAALFVLSPFHPILSCGYLQFSMGVKMLYWR